MEFRSLVTCLAFAVLTTSAGASVDVAEGRHFFDRFVQLSDAFDPAVADLYADSSKIKWLRRYPDGAERVMEMPGSQWRSALTSLMPLAKAKGDRSKYTNVRVEPAGERLRIRADRYSVLKCYSDKNYYMLVDRSSTGTLYVAEEYFENQPQSNC